MGRQPSTSARGMAALITLVALASLVMQYLAVRQEFGYDPMHSIWVMGRYLTILTTVLVAASFGAIATGLREVGPRWLAALTLAILLVAIGFHTLLRGLNELSGFELWSDLGFHTIGPALVALYWLIFAPRGRLSLADLPLFFAWPALYVSYALTRGGLDGRFPYPFLDPLAIGWTPVLWTVASFGAGIAVAGVAMVALDRVLDQVVG